MEQYIKGFKGFTPVKMCGLSPLASFYVIIIIIIIIIVVVVVGDDDTDYWVYLSSDHRFQVYYKVRQVLLQSATGITKCDNFITKCDSYYIVRRLLQSATVQALRYFKREKGSLLFDLYRSKTSLLKLAVFALLSPALYIR